MNFSLNKLVRNLSDSDFKYLSKEFSADLLELVKHKGFYPCEYKDSFEKFSKDKLHGRFNFFSSVKNKYINEKKYLEYLWYCRYLECI